MYKHVTDEQHKAACGVLTPLLSNEQVPCRQNETMVNSLFGNPQMQNCTINVQVFNSPNIQHFQGMNISMNTCTEHHDDNIVDSVNASENFPY